MIFLAVTILGPLAYLHYVGALTEFRAARLAAPFGILAGVASAVIIASMVIFAPAPEDLATGWLRAPVDGFVLTALPEEAVKLICLLAVIAVMKPERAETLVVLGASVAAGFAMMETGLLTLWGVDDPSLALLRLFSATPNHVFVGAIMGASLARARLSRPGAERWILRIGALMAPWLLHGAYNTALFQPTAITMIPGDGPLRGQGVFVAAAITLLVSVLITILLLRRMRSESNGQARRLVDNDLTLGRVRVVSLRFVLMSLVFLMAAAYVALKLVPMASTDHRNGLEFGTQTLMIAYMGAVMGLVFLAEARRWAHAKGRPGPLRLSA